MSEERAYLAMAQMPGWKYLKEWLEQRASVDAKHLRTLIEKGETDKAAREIVEADTYRRVIFQVEKKVKEAMTADNTESK